MQSTIPGPQTQRTTKERIISAIIEIRSGYAGGIRSSEYSPIFKKYAVSAAILFYLRKAGLAEKQGKITRIFPGVSSEELYNAYVVQARKDNKERAKITAAKKLLDKASNKKEEQTDLSPQTKPSTNSNALTEEECISYLKSKGYRVLKPITDYKEV